MLHPHFSHHCQMWQRLAHLIQSSGKGAAVPVWVLWESPQALM